MIDAELLSVPLPSAPAGEAYTPAVEAEIGGVRSLMVVDTGATETLLARPLAERLGVALAPAPDGRDHAGRGVPTWTAGGTLALRVAGGEVRLAAAAVVDLPAALRKKGIGGILSPQTLAGSAQLGLDFVGRRLRVGPGAALRPTGSAERVEVTLARVRLPGDDAALLVFAARLPRGGDIAVMINTGAWEAELAPGGQSASEIGGKGSGGKGLSGKGLSGARVRGARVRARTLRIDDVVVPLPEVLLRAQHAGLGGQIGMQVLRHTALAVPAGGARLRLSVPAAWARRA
jgi:hypothetical protein